MDVIAKTHFDNFLTLICKMHRCEWKCENKGHFLFNFMTKSQVNIASHPLTPAASKITSSDFCGRKCKKV